MIEPAMFAVIRDGETTLYRDPAGSAMVARNLVWGAETLETWLLQHQPADYFDEDAEAGAVVDFDAQALLWYGNMDFHQHVRGQELLDVLIENAWTGFEVLYAIDGLLDLRIAAGDDSLRRSPGLISQDDDEDEAFDERYPTIEDDRNECEDEDDEDQFAWLTILDQDNVVHHRRLSSVTMDLIDNQPGSLDNLMRASVSEVPAEANVAEGMFIDQQNQSICIWGGRLMPKVECLMRANWPGWEINLIPRGGYQTQCERSGPPGRPLEDTQALGLIVPQLLFTQRVDPSFMFGEIGKSVKGFLKLIVGMLTVLVCTPFALFALFTGNWKIGAIIIGLIVFFVVVTFKWFEFRWKRNFQSTIKMAKQEAGDESDSYPVVAGPTDEQTRRVELDKLLATSGLPSLNLIQPHFEDVI